MCGIAGILNFNQNDRVEPEVIRKMTDTLRHRGPDGEGIYVNGNAGLGHRRLAIIDLSPAGHQPMASADGSTWIVYNGEIYNFLTLRAELAASGHQFKSQSDTEVILHAYQEFGPSCVTRFNGMFAFALWDQARQRLFLARDRFGIKPLYFCRTAQQLLFASEIKALLTVLPQAPPQNPGLIYDFLTMGVLDHTDETFFADIHKLPPAHYMLVDGAGNEQRQRYWDFEVNDEIAAIPEREVAARCENFFALLTGSVQSHLISDVPVGSCLSGGLDSSAVVAAISEIIRAESHAAVGPRQRTFSACFQDQRVDERPYMDAVVQATGATAHRIFPQAQKFREELPQLLRHQEEPFAGTSIFAQWEVMRLARDHGVIVLLDGQGADEQLLGYRKFYFFYLRHLLRQGRAGLALHELIQHFASWEVLKTLQLRRGLRYWHDARFGSAAVAHGLLQEAFAKNFRAQASALGAENNLGARLKADMTRFSLPVLLRYEDKNSMAFSREARVPFLDHRLVEYVAGLPLNLKLRDGWTKYCLRRGGQGRIPPLILRRKDKLGFATPEDEWLRQTLYEDFRQTFGQAAFLPELVNMPNLQNHFEAFLRGKRPLLSGEFFFRFFILEKWARCWGMSFRRIFPSTGHKAQIDGSVSAWEDS